MPIYEFYCPDCHTVFSFLSREVDTTTRPRCPRCRKKRLSRRISRFAIARGRPEPAPDGPPPGLDERTMERAVESLARQAEGLDESDPRAMAGLMRGFYESAGLRMGEGMREALRRMEAGEDPDEIEERLGDALDREDPFGEQGKPARGRRIRLRAPAVDPTLYEMP